MVDYYARLYDFARFVARENTIDVDGLSDIEEMRRKALTEGGDVTIYVETMISISKSALGCFATYLDLVLPHCHACQKINKFHDLLQLLWDLGLIPEDPNATELVEPQVDENGVPHYNCCSGIDSDLYKFCTAIFHNMSNMSPHSKDFRMGIFALIRVISDNDSYMEYYDEN